MRTTTRRKRLGALTVAVGSTVGGDEALEHCVRLRIRVGGPAAAAVERTAP